MKLPIIILNEAPTKPGHSIYCRLLNKEDETKPVEVLIYDVIGKDWNGEGFDAKDFVNQLRGLDEKRELTIRVNSRGGIVDEGIAIYNRMREWKGKTVAIVDGSAASIASVIIMGAKEVRMPKSAEILIHEAHAIAYGHAEDMRELANRLDSASDRIANIYAEKTGKTVEEMRNYMRKTTVFNGSQAKEMGLADVLTDEAPLYNLSPEDIENFRQPPGKTKPEADAKQGADSTSTKDTMRDAIIALLNKLGIKHEASATDAQLLALLGTQAENATVALQAAQKAGDKAGDKPDPTIVTLQNAVNALTEANKAEKKSRITAEIDKLIGSNQLPGAMRDKAIARALADETILDEYRALPVVEPGTEPLNASIEITAEDPKQIEKAVLKNWGGREILTPAQARERGRIRAEIINKNFNRIWPLMNANTVSADLKRTVILQQSIRAFAIKILPLTAFSTVLNGLKLEGTDKISIPYFPLDTTASTDFNASNGYDTFGNTNSDAKTLTVDKRKYQGLKWTSSELARQPFMDVMKGAALKAEQLGIDVVNDVLSLITLASFGASVKAEQSNAFDLDDAQDLRGVADLANWPGAGRSMLLNSAYDVNLTKDARISNAQSWGDNAPIREGRIVRIAGFDYFQDSRIPSNSENLEGFIAYQSALLVGFSPVNPTPEVRNMLTRYEVVQEPGTGAMFEYRMWGDPDMDTTKEIIEANYGKDEGELTALKRITNQ